jgi:hypothetical protein
MEKMSKLEDDIVEFVNREMHDEQFAYHYHPHHDIIVVVGGKYAALAPGKEVFGFKIKPILSSGVDMMGIMPLRAYQEVAGMPFEFWVTALGEFK